MGAFSNLFKPKSDTIKGVIEGTGTLAKDLRQAITGDNPELDMKLAEYAHKAEELSTSLVKAEMTGNWLQRSWRPILALVCTYVILMQFGIEPLINWVRVARELAPVPPSTFAAAELWPILLGLITYRSYEKTQGIRNALGQG